MDFRLGSPNRAYINPVSTGNSMNIIFFISILAAGVLAFSRFQQKQLVQTRGVAKEEFTEKLADLGVSADVSGAVYDYYRKESTMASFQVAPDFSLTTLFKKSHEDIDDDAQQILTNLGLRLPDQSILRQWTDPLTTVRDMVLWINWIKNQQKVLY